MKRLLGSGFVLLFCAALLNPACAASLIIKGSNTFGEELGPQLVQAFTARYPQISVELESSSSGAGMAALLDGECEIATMSRVANEDELRLAKSRSIKLKHYTVGYYGIALIVHESLPVKGLSDAHVRDIFTGKIKNWNAVGGPDSPIHVYIRDPASGTYLGFQELAMERQPYTPTATSLMSYSEIIQAVKADAYGIGFVGMPLAHEPGVKMLHVNGVPPTATAVAQDLYPYARLLRMYTNEEKESRQAKQFIRFVQSRQGQNILEKMGFVRRFSLGRSLWDSGL